MTYILLIEDDAAIGDMLTLLLDLEGYRVTWCRTAAAALAVLVPATPSRAELPSPDLILLDLALGTSSGVTLMQHVAALGHPVPPIVVLSAGDAQVLESSAATLGAVATVRKPFMPAELVQVLASIGTKTAHPDRGSEHDAPAC